MQLFTDLELTRLSTLIVHYGSVADRPLDDHMCRDIRRCWQGLQKHHDLIAERDVFWNALHRHYMNGYSMELLADLTGISIGSFSNNFSARNLTRYPSSRRTQFAGPPARHYEVNPTALDDPSHSMTSYILGFLWADGSLMKGKLPDTYIGLRIVLKASDHLQLQMIRSHLGSTAPIQFLPSTRQPNGQRYPQCVLCIYSTELAARLVKYGFATREGGRSNSAPPDAIRSNELHFWRGMVDGDGCIQRDRRWKNPLSGWSLELAATRATVDLFRDFLERHLCNARIDIRLNGISTCNYRISVTGPSAAEAICLLYPAGYAGLERKLVKATWLREAVKQAKKIGIHPGQVGSRRQWLGSRAAKASLKRLLPPLRLP